MTDQLDHLQSALADRYVIERELGRGGMATVYLAEDLKHHRHVAIKVLDPELARALGSERFLREVEVTAKLTHLHILTLIDSGEADGFLYYVMPYIEGETLRERMDREGQLPLEDALRITKEVAAALSYAHSNDVVHRDIKPENVLLSAGEAVVADFGIARAITEAGGEHLTETGISIGTPAYMSPEQASGAQKIDGRSDVYSLGCLLYEMLAGEPPYTGPTAQAVLAKKLSEATPRVSVVRERVPSSVEAAIDQALAKAPADRFVTAEKFSDALTTQVSPMYPRSANRARNVVLGVVGVAIVAAIVVTLRGGTAGSSIAVLPCTNTTGDSAAEYLADGLTEDLWNQIARSTAFEKVTSFTSSMRYKGSSLRPRQIGESLGVNVLVFCRYARRGNAEALSLEAVNARDATVLWSAEDEGEGIALAGPSMDVADSLVRVLGATRGERELATGRKREPPLRAVNLYKEGQYFLRKYTPDAMRHSMELFRQAIDADSMFAEPYVGLGEAYLMLAMGHSELDSREALPLMREAAERALALDTDIADAHTLLAYYQLDFGWDWEAAEREARHAIAINPNSAAAYDALAFTLRVRGRHEEAFTASDRAAELAPVDPLILANNGVVRYLAGRYRDAVARIEHALALEPEWYGSLWALGAVYAELGEFDRAVEYLERAYELGDRLSFLAGYLGYAHGLAGDTASGSAILRDLSSAPVAVASGKAALARSLIHIGLGQAEQAIARLEESCRERSSNLWDIVTGPPGRRLARDPGYAALLQCLERRL